MLVASAVEVRQRKPGSKLDKRKGGRYAGACPACHRARSGAAALCGFVESAVALGTRLPPTTGPATPASASAATHFAVAERGTRWRRSICRSSISSFPT